MRALSCRGTVVRVALAGIVGVTALAFCPRAQAGVAVVSDDFNYATVNPPEVFEALLGGGGPGTPFRAPRLVNLPGGLWQTPGGNPDDTLLIGSNHQSVFPSEALHLQHSAGAAVSLASSGAYTKPTQLQISVDVGGFGTDGYGDSRTYLGFFPVAYESRNANPVNPFGPVTTHFTGLSLNLDGSVALYQDGVVVGGPIAYGGTFVPAAVTHLSYEVNTATGALSNISVQGSSSDYSFVTTAFTDAATAYAGLGMNGYGGFADNFSVSSVPEPAMMGLGGLLGGLFMVRRRAKA
jgi:hypothetical protein